MNKIVLLLVISTSFVASAENLNLDNGVGVNEESLSDIAQTSWEYAYASDVQVEAGDSWAIAFYLTNDSKKLYSLSDSAKLYLTNYETKMFENYWSYSRWAHLLNPSEIPQELSSLGYQDLFSEIGGVTMDEHIGCIGSTPLKYGDIDSDGIDEVVLSIGGELIIFSPDFEKTVFSMLWYASDWVGLTNEYNIDLNGQPSLVDGESYQYASSVYSIDNGSHRGHRSYSKVFDGDFDEDGNFDLVVWQKVYRSNKVGGLDGFHNIRSELRHYERDLTTQAESEAGVTGEYLPQETSENDIKNWLSENSLTWSKGYPSVSECEGEEGQLIPEMHDPLLNDPEVLQ